MKVNDRPVKELQIIPKTGKKTGCLNQLSDAELVWIASELRKAIFRPS